MNTAPLPPAPASAKKLATAAICAFGLLGAAACSQENPTTEPVEAPVEGVRLELLDNGRAPRTPVRFQLGEGEAEEQSLVFKATQGLEQKVENGEGEAIPYEEATLELPLTATVDGPAAEGAHKTEVAVGTPGGTNKELNEDMASATGFLMHNTVEPTGRVQSRSFSAPEGATDGARASVEQALTQMNDLPILFPEEAIGQGAKWQLHHRVDAGISLRQTLTYTAEKIEGNTVTLGVDVERKPAVSSLEDTDLEVLAASSTARGSITVDLHKPLPSTGKVTINTTVTYGKADEPLRVKQIMTTRNQWD